MATAVFALIGSAAAAECRLEKYAELPVLMVGSRPVVSAEVNGSPALFIADSGAFFSTVSVAAADRLQLGKVRRAPGLALYGVGGRIEVQVGAAETFDIGPLKLRNVEFLIGGAGITVVDGLLGQNLLGVRETEYDLAGGAIRLFQSKGCEKSPLAYWAGDTSVSTLEISRTTPLSPHVVASARLNGRRIRVLFDTGAPRSVLKYETAQMAGVPLEGAEVQRTRGYDLNLKPIESWIAPLGSFGIGQESVSNARIRVSKMDLHGADMLLGADFFLSHRVLISREQRKIYFSPNGGPMFLADQPR